MASVYLSPLRYPGSKRHLANFVEQTLLANHFFPSLYIEPFAGGASVALHLLSQAMVSKVILMDRDPWIASFWKTVFWDTQWLIDQIEHSPISLDIWLELKQANPTTCREQAWACLYLNRTSFSGIMRPEVGPLGGRKQSSKYKIDCRFPRQEIINRILMLSSFRDRVYAVWDCSWDEGLDRIRDEQRKGHLPQNGLFFYLDPPFFEKAESLYRFYFSYEDHIRLRDTLLVLQDKWLLSYDSVEQVEFLYGEAISSNNGMKQSHVQTFYFVSSLQERKKGREVVLSNFNVLPKLNGYTRNGGTCAKH